MTYLKFYDLEKERFPTAIHITLEFPFAQKIIKKIVRHFKVNFAGVRPQPTRWVGYAHNNYSISLPKQSTLLLVCHEVAHLYNKQYFGDWSHCKKLMRTIKRIVNYALKMLPFWLGDSRIVSLIQDTSNQEVGKHEVLHNA
jgi:hypothetical protein